MWCRIKIWSKRWFVSFKLKNQKKKFTERTKFKMVLKALFATLTKKDM